MLRGREAQQRRADGHNNTALATVLLESWAWGGLSAAHLQVIAAGALRDGTSSLATKALAQIGCSRPGQTRNNTQRDLTRALQAHVRGYKDLPEPVMLQVPLTGFNNGPVFRTAPLPYLPLHRVFAHTFQHYPKHFAKTWGASALAIEFWSTLPPDDPTLAQWLPALAQRDITKMLVYALHGDAVPVFRHKSLMVWSSTCMLGHGSAKDLKSLMFAYWSYLRAQSDILSEDTEKLCFQAVEWDLEALWLGVNPSVDWQQVPWPAGSREAALAGTPLAGGFCALPWLLKGDLDHYQKGLGLESSAETSPCCFCPANRTNNMWTDFRATAQWKQTPFSSMARAQWEALHPQRHPVLNVLQLGHCSRSFLGPLHCAGHQSC